MAVGKVGFATCGDSAAYVFIAGGYCSEDGWPVRDGLNSDGDSVRMGAIGPHYCELSWTANARVVYVVLSLSYSVATP
jgi:hypothetical protein